MTSLRQLCVGFVDCLPFHRCMVRSGRTPNTAAFRFARTCRCNVAVRLCERFWMLLFARVLQGIAAAASWTAGLALLADVYPAQQRGKVMGIALSGQALGTLLGAVVGGWLYEWGGFRLPFLVAAGLALLDGLLRLTILNDNIRRPPTWSRHRVRTSWCRHGIHPCSDASGTGGYRGSQPCRWLRTGLRVVQYCVSDRNVCRAALRWNNRRMDWHTDGHDRRRRLRCTVHCTYHPIIEIQITRIERKDMTHDRIIASPRAQGTALFRQYVRPWPRPSRLHDEMRQRLR